MLNPSLAVSLDALWGIGTCTVFEGCTANTESIGTAGNTDGVGVRSYRGTAACPVLHDAEYMTKMNTGYRSDECTHAYVLPMNLQVGARRAWRGSHNRCD